MGIPTAQAAQPISQQQPAPQGKGGQQITPNTPVDATQSNMTATAVMPNGQQGKGMQSQQQPQQQPQQQYGKGGTTNSATSGQARMGQANPYPNTIQPWDNANIQPQTQSGKGKGY